MGRHKLPVLLLLRDKRGEEASDAIDTTSGKPGWHDRLAVLVRESDANVDAVLAVRHPQIGLLLCLQEGREEIRGIRAG